MSIAVNDQIGAGLDVISDGEQTRLDFNLSFYGFIDGIDLNRRLRAILGLPRTISGASTGSSPSFPLRAD